MLTTQPMVTVRMGLVIALVMTIMVVQIHAQSDTAATIESKGTQAVSVSWKLVSGGGATVITTPTHQVGVSVGQPAAGAVQTPTHQLQLGFWYGVPASPWACPIALTGDVNLSGDIVSSDIIYLVNFVFKAGADPLPCTGSGDVNCSSNISPADIIYLVNHVFKLGPAPCDACTLIPCGLDLSVKDRRNASENLSTTSQELTMRYSLLHVVYLFALLVLTPAMAAADVPFQVNIQGRLLDATGAPLPPGLKLFEFRIFDMDVGGTKIWPPPASEAHLLPTDSAGLWTAEIGAHEPIPPDVFAAPERWLEIIVDDGTNPKDTLPRVRLNSTPYAHSSMLSQETNWAFQADSSNWARGLVPDVISDIHIVDGTIAFGDIGQNGAADGQVMKWAGGVWFAADDETGGWTRDSNLLYTSSPLALVGIGTTAPGGELEISSLDEVDVLLNRQTDAYATLLGFMTSGTQDWLMYTPSGGHEFLFENSSGHVVQTLSQNGRVGIGTMAPTHKLTVDSGDVAIRGLDGWSGPGHAARLIMGDPNHGIAAEYGKGLHIWTFSGPGHAVSLGTATNDTLMMVHSTGNVSIGESLRDSQATLSVRQVSAPGASAIHGSTGIVPPISSGGGIGVKGSFFSDGVGGTGVYGSAVVASPLGGTVGVWGYTNDPGGYGVYSEGGLATSGVTASVVSTNSYGHREVYALESAENWCEDFGSGQLVDGEATVVIDPVFAETVRLTDEYHVFLTPLGDAGLYVTTKLPTSFTIRTLGGQSSSIAFDYRLVARRRGYENRRLESAEHIARAMSDMARMRAQAAEDLPR